MPDPRLAFLRSTDLEQRPMKCSFKHEVAGAEGEVALHYWSPKQGVERKSKHLLLFILGNPALLDYYVPFLDHLYALLPPGYAIISNSHIGHSPELPLPSKPLEVPAHLASKIELVQTLREELDDWSPAHDDSTRPKLCLMGHSFGAWLVCETMKQIPEAITAGYMLFPSNGWLSETWNGRTTGLITTPLAQTVLPTLSYLLRPVLPLVFPSTTQSLLRSPSTIAQCLATAQSEFEHIREPDFEWFKSQSKADRSSGIFGVWSAGNLDGWVGREGPVIRDCLGGEQGGRVKLVQGIPHAFCLRDDHSEIVAQIVASWLEPTLAPISATESQQVGEAPIGSTTVPM